MSSNVDVTTGNRVAAEVEKYIEGNGGQYVKWYAGITCDVEDRVFGAHCVDRTGKKIYRDCGNVDTARAVEKYFLDKRHCDGGPGGGDHRCRFFYAYLKSNMTRP